MLIGLEENVFGFYEMLLVCRLTLMGFFQGGPPIWNHRVGEQVTRATGIQDLSTTDGSWPHRFHI